MADAERWPIDFDAIQKGDVIPVSQLETILGVSRFARSGTHFVENAEYQKLLKDFQGKVKHELRKRDIKMTVACDHGTITFLEDEEAAHYNDRLFRSGEKRMRTAAQQAMGCDANQMTEETRTRWRRSLVVMGAKLAGMRSSYKQVQAVPHQRKTPGLPPPN